MVPGRVKKHELAGGNFGKKERKKFVRFRETGVQRIFWTYSSSFFAYFMANYHLVGQNCLLGLFHESSRDEVHKIRDCSTSRAASAVKSFLF